MFPVVRLSFQKLLENRVLVVDKSIDHDKPYFDFYVVMFFTTSKKLMFSFRARAEKGIARHIDARGVVGI